MSAYSWRSKTILIAMIVTIGLIYLFAAKLGFAVFDQDIGVSNLWPAVGIALASLLLTLLVLAARWSDHRSVEAAKREAETKARSLVEHVPAIVYQVQFGSIVTWRYVSQRINSVLGFTPDEWMCDPQLWFKQVHPDDREEVLKKGMSSSLSGRPFLCEYRMFARDGRIVWFRDEGNVVRDPEKKSVVIQGVMVDITEKKRAEILQSVLYRLAEQTTSSQTLEQYYQLVHGSVSQLVDARNFYIGLFDSGSNDFSFPFSISERRFTMDPQSASKGLPGYVIANGPLLADSEKITELTRTGVLLDDGVPFVSWLGVPLKTGEKTLGLLSVQSFYEEQKFVYADLMALSLLAAEVATTLEQKRAEKALQDKTAQLQAINQAMTLFLEKNDWKEASHIILRSALRETGSEYGFMGVVSDGVLRIFAHEGIVWHQHINRDFYENAMRTYHQTGYFEFTNFNNLFGSVITQNRAVISNDPPSDGRSGHSLPSGHPPLKNFLGVPFHHAGSVIGLIGVANRPGGYSNGDFAKLDFLSQTAVALYLTYLQAQKEEVLQEELRQSQKMEAIGRLAGGVAHDFNNLLMAITGYSELLLLKLREDPLKTDVKEILKASSQGAALTRQLLAFGRRQIMDPKILNLNSVLREMEDLLTRLLGEEIDLIMICHSELGMVKADPGQIEQVILNLSLNARDAMPNGGQLLLETFEVNVSEADSMHQPFGIPAGSYVVLRVKDTGVGMDEPTLTRIFEPFFTTRQTVGGSGLGLATVYGIIKQSNGHVNVQSELGAGTTFEIYLAKVDAQAETSTTVPSTPETSNPVRTILLVDDNDAVRRATSALLRAHGFGVLEASNGVDAVELADTHDGPIDLLITDVVMPRMNGASLAHEILQKWPNTKILFMSGYSEESVLSRNPSATFLQKPFSMGTFFGRIHELLERQSPSS